MIASYELELFADYRQFYLQDDDRAYGDLSDAWTEEASARMLAVAPHTIGVGTARNTSVPVRINLNEQMPSESLDEYDRVVDCSIEVRTGRMVVAGCTDYFPDALRIPIAPGTYRVRVFYSDLASVSNDQLQGTDSYRVDLWPGSPMPPTVLKPD